jgi:hypothetical protein
MRVRVPSQNVEYFNPSKRGLPPSAKKVPQIVVVLDREGKAYDKLTGQYIKLVEVGEDHYLELDPVEGRYVTLNANLAFELW